MAKKKKPRISEDIVMDALVDNHREHDVIKALDLSMHVAEMCDSGKVLSVDEFGLLALALKHDVLYVPNPLPNDDPEKAVDLDLIAVSEDSLCILFDLFEFSKYKPSSVSYQNGGRDKVSAAIRWGEPPVEVDLWLGQTDLPNVHFGKYIVTPEFFQNAVQAQMFGSTYHVPHPLDFLTAKLEFLKQEETPNHDRIQMLFGLTGVIEKMFASRGVEYAAAEIIDALGRSSQHKLARAYLSDSPKLIGEDMQPFYKRKMVGSYSPHAFEDGVNTAREFLVQMGYQKT